MPNCVLAVAAMLVASTAAGFVLPAGTYPFRTYGVESGLGNLSAMQIAQDTRGFLWVATQDGIYRYDGTRFRRYGLEDGLPSTFVTMLRAGRDGTLWAVTAAGVVRFDGTRFHLQASLPRANVNAIAIDPKGKAWVASQDGLFADARRAGGPASAVWCDGGDVWIAHDGVVSRLQGPSVALTPRERIDSIVVDARRRVWARSGKHLWSMERDGSDVRDETAALPGTSNNGYLALDARGDLWVPTDRGVAIRDATGWRVIGEAEGLPTGWARDVFEDREGSIWVASLGVHRMLGRGELVSYKRGLPSEVTWCFRWDRDGRLLVGTDLGLARSTASGWEVVKGTEGAQVRTFVEEEDGTRWAGGTPAEVIRIRGGEVRRFALGGRTVMRLLRDREGAIWAATRGAGLLRKGANENEFVAVAPGEDFRDVIEDRAGRIWATGQRGLLRLQNGTPTRFTKANGLRHDHLAYLRETRAGDLWLAYFEPLGVDRLHVEGDTLRVVEHLDTTTGLAANKVFLIGEDDRGRTWVGTGAGVDIVSRGSVEHLSTVDGLAGDDTDAMAFLCDARGHVFIGTSSGFSHYVPRSDPPHRAAPAVALTSATLGDLVLTDGVMLPASRQNLDFAARFSALSYFKPDVIEYEVRMEGLDDAFRRVNEPHAHWTRVPPGDYRFEVRARLRPGPWSEPVGFSFAIRPAWWQTNRARFAAIALLAVLAWLAYRWRVAWLRNRNAELQALVDQRTRELAELSVTDALTGLRNRRYLQASMPRLTAGPLVFLMIDIDHFKQINDRYGHLAGDEVLVAVCDVLRRQTGAGDSVIRWGGEELLYLAATADGAAAAERIRAAVEEHEVQGIRLTCSIGFAPFPFSPGVSWEEVIDIADICLYRAKAAGRNCWIGVSPRSQRQDMVALIRESFDEAVARGEIGLEIGGPSRSPSIQFAS